MSINPPFRVSPLGRKWVRRPGPPPADDIPNVEGLSVDVIEFVRSVATRKNVTFNEAKAKLLLLARNRFASLAKYEVLIRCEACGKKSNRCKCPPERLAAVVAARPREDW
jgi:hypothetical protein